MKRIAILALALALVLSLASCGSSAKEVGTVNDDGTVTLKVGASITPHAEILESVKAKLAEEGIVLEIVEYTDYVQPNLSLEDGSLDANYFQHGPYLEDFNSEQGTHLSSAGAVHYEPFGIYPGRVATISELPDGGKVSIPNDGTNEARALLLLEAQGLIKLKEGVGLDATILDIEENPKNLEIVELEAAQLTISLDDVDLSVINGNYAMQAGLSVGKDAIAVEDKDSEAAETYANIVAVRTGDEDNEYIVKLMDALTSEDVRQFIEDTYDGAVIPKF